MNGLCVTNRCGTPATALLCRRCTGELVEALRALSGGAVQRRAKLDPTDRRVTVAVDGEGRPLPYLADESFVASDLMPRQGLLADLQDTIVRQDNTGPSGAGRVRGSDATTVDFHVKASAVASEARRTITTWARRVHARNPRLPMPRSYVQACDWLAELGPRLANDPDSGELYRTMLGLVATIRATIDIRAERTYIGICSSPIGKGGEIQECPHDLYAELGEDFHRCPLCGTEHNVSRRQTRLLKAMRAQLLSPQDIRTVLTRYQPEGDVPPIGTLHYWASTGRLTKKPALPGDPHHRPRYRVGEVLDLMASLERAKTRKRPKGKTA